MKNRRILLLGFLLGLLYVLYSFQSNQASDYLINEQHLCSPEGAVDLLLVILSGSNKFSRRQSVRETYASLSRNNTGNVRYLFILGFDPKNDQTVQKEIEKEKDVYNDIVQADFKDTYFNLSRKVIKVLDWAVRFCGHTKYIMKLDDDTWLNVPKIVEFLKKTSINFTNSVIGQAHINIKPFRNAKHKFFVPRHEFNKTYFPHYNSGSGYIMTPQVAHAVLSKSKNIPFFKFEDVYLGMVLQRLKFTITNVTQMRYWVHSEKKSPCLFKNKYLIAHKVSPSYMRRIWKTSCK